MIIITGGAGFIGSNLINELSKTYKIKIVSVDHNNAKNKNYFENSDVIKIKPLELNFFLSKFKKEIKIIVHLGAITSTTENDVQIIIENNLSLSIFLWRWSLKNKKRFIYASSAATYGDGKSGFNDIDSIEHLSKLLPLNLYGWSKHTFDKFIIKKKKMGEEPIQCVGLKFFNVYGPNEFHKGEMRSLILKIFEKLKKKKKVFLFKSHNTLFKDGEQLRDFIYVKDVIQIINWFIDNPKVNGIFNVGTGNPRTFKDLANNVFLNCNIRENIKYTPTPEKIREQYQYFTKAETEKLKKTGYKKKFTSLEEGIKDYIRNYLSK